MEVPTVAVGAAVLAVAAGAEACTPTTPRIPAAYLDKLHHPVTGGRYLNSMLTAWSLTILCFIGAIISATLLSVEKRRMQSNMTHLETKFHALCVEQRRNITPEDAALNGMLFCAFFWACLIMFGSAMTLSEVNATGTCNDCVYVRAAHEELRTLCVERAAADAAAAEKRRRLHASGTKFHVVVMDIVVLCFQLMLHFIVFLCEPARTSDLMQGLATKIKTNFIFRRMLKLFRACFLAVGNRHRRGGGDGPAFTSTSATEIYTMQKMLRVFRELLTKTKKVEEEAVASTTETTTEPAVVVAAADDDEGFTVVEGEV